MAKDSSKAIDQIKELIVLIYHAYDKNLNLVHQYLKELNGYVLRTINQFIGEVVVDKTYTDSLIDVADCTTIDQTNEYMNRFIGELIVHLELIQKEKNNDMIQTAKLYIKNNYMNEISLDDLAEVIGLSKSYLSRMFKKTESINFKDYLAKVRMEKARELLMNGGLSVAEVSYAVGYIEPNYFSKAFKKYTGLSPKDLKK